METAHAANSQKDERYTFLPHLGVTVGHAWNIAYEPSSDNIEALPVASRWVGTQHKDKHNGDFDDGHGR